jgi:hypothetical protein
MLIFLTLLGAPAEVRKATVRHVCPFVCINNSQPIGNEFQTVSVRKPNAGE